MHVYQRYVPSFDIYLTLTMTHHSNLCNFLTIVTFILFKIIHYWCDDNMKLCINYISIECRCISYKHQTEKNAVLILLYERDIFIYHLQVTHYAIYNFSLVLLQWRLFALYLKTNTWKIIALIYKSLIFVHYYISQQCCNTVM